MAFFSIVIPTRGRARQLLHSLRTVLEQDFADIEVIVQDNASGPDVRAVAESFQDPRVRYYRSDVDLAMQHNWEAALPHARGEFVLYLGDDDGLTPDCLSRAARCIARTGVDIVNLNSASYGWPCCPDPERRDYLSAMTAMAMTNDDYIMLSRDLELRSIFSNLSLGALSAMIYVAVVRRSIIDKVLNKYRIYFGHPVPDVWTAFANLWATDRFACLSWAGHVSGVSGASTGGGLLVGGEKEKIKATIKLNRLEVWPVDLPQINGNLAALMLSVFHQGKLAFFADRPDIVVPYALGVDRALTAVWATGDAQALAEAVVWAQAVGAQFGFTPAAPPQGAPPPPPVDHAKADVLGPDGVAIIQSEGGLTYLMLDGRVGGVSNIYEACRYLDAALRAARR